MEKETSIKQKDLTFLLDSLNKALEGLENVRDRTHYCNCDECGGYWSAYDALKDIDWEGIQKIKEQIQN